MLIETGIVSAIQGNNVSVSTQNQLACSSFKAVDSCGNGSLEKFFS
jgi:positive regulator of sigma E activity